VGALVLRFIVARNGGGAIANVQGQVGASAVRNTGAFAIAAAIGDVDDAVCVSKAASDGEVVGAAAADNAGVVSNPTAIAETWGWQGAGDDAGGTDEAVGVVAAAAGDVGISGVKRAVIITAVIVVMAGGSIVGVAAGAVGVDAEGTGGVAKSGSIVGIAGGGGVGVAGAGGTDGADVVAGPEFAVAVGDVGVSGISIEGAGVDGAGGIGGGGVETYYCFMGSRQRRQSICGGGN